MCRRSFRLRQRTPLPSRCFTIRENSPFILCTQQHIITFAISFLRNNVACILRTGLRFLFDTVSYFQLGHFFHIFGPLWAFVHSGFAAAQCWHCLGKDVVVDSLASRFIDCFFFSFFQSDTHFLFDRDATQEFRCLLYNRLPTFTSTSFHSSQNTR